jgi:hypothetical protein
MRCAVYRCMTNSTSHSSFCSRTTGLTFTNLKIYHRTLFASVPALADDAVPRCKVPGNCAPPTRRAAAADGAVRDDASHVTKRASSASALRRRISCGHPRSVAVFRRRLAGRRATATGERPAHLRSRLGSWRLGPPTISRRWCLEMLCECCLYLHFCTRPAPGPTRCRRPAL